MFFYESDREGRLGTLTEQPENGTTIVKCAGQTAGEPLSQTQPAGAEFPDDEKVATIGFFDGVHRGHMDLIGQLCRLAAAEHRSSLLITFKNHPRTVLQTGFVPELLTTPAEKRRLLSASGADGCLEMTFTPELSRLSARDFMETWLRRKLNVKTLLVGYDHHFGHDAAGTFEDYRAMGYETGLNVVRAREFRPDGMHISSSQIRLALKAGDVGQAAQMLGRPYGFEGKVVHGEHVGHRLGYPTANFDVDAIGKMLPRDGSYVVIAERNGQTLCGMLYIGHRPTFGSGLKRTAEVYLLHFHEEIYGETLRVEFLSKLRGEQHFESADDLRRQLAQDCAMTENVWQKYRRGERI